ncbi:MAG TPA: ATP-dependent DNA ligase [Anaerolineae bacterium]|nr:ATP-dependent DNA ligase [Anaerolineae bacterium]
MEYRRLAEAFNRIESTTKRIAMTDYLSDLIRQTPPDLIGKVVYLTQGKLYPDFVGIEIGMAEKLAVRSVSIATGLSAAEISEDLGRTGDIGDTVFQELQKAAPGTREPLTVSDVHSTLDTIAKTAGPGSVEKKINMLADLLKRATPLEAKYIARTVTGKLRLGVADMTILDALAIVYGGGRLSRPVIERAYNVTSDLGMVAEALAEGGLEAVEKFHVTVGKPIRPMLAERLKTPEEIMARTGGECVAEYKYDGERVQIHKQGSEVTLFSRRIENITKQYPDVVELAKDTIRADTAIIEAEIVALDPETGENRPFQELMRRRRKYGIEEMAKEFPASIFYFDCIYADGRDLTKLSFPERRKVLGQIVKAIDRARFVEFSIVDSVNGLEEFFEKAVQQGTEGVICKAVGPESIYQAGSRGWLWIKYKREYRSEMTDTVDLVVVGAYYGRGRRAGVYGSLLMAIYVPETDTFRTITRLGAGFTDKDLAELPKMLEEYRIESRHPRVEAKERPDVWFVPGLVLEVIGAEITLSPLHTAGLNMFRPGSGLAIRFPRFTGKYRFDKAPEDATTEQEIIEMYTSRIRKVAS